MTAFKFLKKKKKEEEKKLSEKAEIEKEEKKEEAKKIEEIREKDQKRIAWRYILAPHVTEKATLLQRDGQYVFKVAPEANKTEIKKSIEEIYGVKVEKVRIINVPRKKRRRGRIEGWRKGYKKAIVKIKEGQKIEILPR
jgi:large subunit ribosomal protein L23